MRYLLLSCISFLLLTDMSWETDFDKAKQLAQSEHRHILVSFSGSDWCAPCINMHKEVFESKVFTDYAADHLVLVNADFPRLRKHKLSDEQQARNDRLAEMYNKEGIFPLTVLTTSDGKVIKTWEGYPKESADKFTDEIKSFDDGR